MTRAPSERNTSSKAALNFASRSWMRNRAGRGRSARIIFRLRLLDDPGAVGITRRAAQMHAPALELDEEQDIDPSKGQRLDGEEVTCNEARRLLAQECAPREPALP